MKWQWMAGGLAIVLAGCQSVRVEPELVKYMPETTAEYCRIYNVFGDRIQLHPDSGYMKYNNTPVRLPKKCEFAATQSYSLAPELVTGVVEPLWWGTHKYPVRKIALDAGHGGSDPGAKGKFSNEKTLNLQLTLKVARELQKRGFVVYLVRHDDTFISLDGRVTRAKQAKADVFVSIHHNSASRPSANGVEVFARRPQENCPAGAVSTLLAALIQQRLAPAAGGANRGVQFANFVVIYRNNPLPAVLIEAGFISNVQDEKKLNNAQYQQKMAVAIAEGIADFRARKR